MAYGVVGITRTNLFSGNSAEAITGPQGAGTGPIDVILIAEDAGIFIGNEDLKAGLPGTGFELTPDVEYRFTFHDGGAAYLATTSPTNVAYRMFVYPHIS